jgi:hypothetical protein
MDALANELRRCRDDIGELDADRTMIRGMAPVAPPPPARVRRRAGRLPLLLTLAGLVLGAIVVAAILFNGSHVGGGGNRHGGGAGTTAVTLRGVGNYDPAGSPDTHADTASAATDGNAATDWYTQIYATPAFGNLKPGLGLVVDAGRTVKLTSLTVQTPTPGFVATVKAGDSRGGPFTDDSQSQTVGPTTTFRLSGANARYYVVWISQLPAGGKAEISEVKAR